MVSTFCFFSGASASPSPALAEAAAASPLVGVTTGSFPSPPVRLSMTASSLGKLTEAIMR